jgi:hypothetical protein
MKETYLLFNSDLDHGHYALFSLEKKRTEFLINSFTHKLIKNISVTALLTNIH